MEGRKNEETPAEVDLPGSQQPSFHFGGFNLGCRRTIYRTLHCLVALKRTPPKGRTMNVAAEPAPLTVRSPGATNHARAPDQSIAPMHSPPTSARLAKWARRYLRPRPIPIPHPHGRRGRILLWYRRHSGQRWPDRAHLRGMLPRICTVERDASQRISGRRYGSCWPKNCQ